MISEGFYDAFIAKYDTLKNLIWSAQFGGSDMIDCKAVTVDHSGNIVVGGYFQNELNFETFLNLQSFGYSELFILWITPEGNLFHHTNTSGANYAEVFDLAVLQNDNIVITGNFYGNINKDNVMLSASQGTDFFCIKVNQTGVFTWGVQSTGGGNLCQWCEP